MDYVLLLKTGKVTKISADSFRVTSNGYLVFEHTEYSGTKIKKTDFMAYTAGEWRTVAPYELYQEGDEDQ
jgi:hypothetical protein